MTDKVTQNAEELVLYEVSDDIATITLNRPHRRNALNYAAYSQLEDVLRRVVRDPDVRCAIVTGADPAFCSGDDVQEVMAGSNSVLKRGSTVTVRHQPTPAAMAALECSKPLIAAVNGAAIGWGMELALYADIRIASTSATFSELFIKRGLTCDIGGFYRLPSIVGPAKAAELLFTGDVIDATEAQRIGLVTKTVPHNQLMEQAKELAKRIAVNPPLALQYMKEGLRKATYGDVSELGGWAIETIHKLMGTEDHKEGVASFLEKRPPKFTGR